MASLLVKIINKEGIWKKIGLPVQQRDYVWDARNIVEFLDSICRGYPLGMIVYKKLNDDSIQIYDGQQRAKTLQMVFDDKEFSISSGPRLKEKKCKVYIDIDLFYEILNKSENKQENQKNRINNKIVFPRFKNYRQNKWGTYPFEVIPVEEYFEKDEQSGVWKVKKDKKEEFKNFMSFRTGWKTQEEPKDPEEHYWISLPELWKWEGIQTDSDISGKVEKIKGFISEQLNKVLLLEKELKEVKENDLEYLFVILNRAGKRVTEEEQYFAVLNTYCSKAHFNIKDKIKEILDNLPSKKYKDILDFFDILRILVNIAHSEDEKTKGEKSWKHLRLTEFGEREKLAEKIKKLCESNIEKLKKLKEIMKIVLSKLAEHLYYGLKHINKKLIDIVIVAAYLQKDYNNYDWGKIAKEIFIINESKKLGENRGRELLRRLFENFCKRKSFLKDLDDVGKIREAFEDNSNKEKFKGNHYLWLSIYQKVPINEKNLAIDHILPKAWIKNKKKIDQLKKEINDLGNLWIVDAEKNNKWLDKVPPLKKFEEVKDSNILKDLDKPNKLIKKYYKSIDKELKKDNELSKLKKENKNKYYEEYKKKLLDKIIKEASYITNKYKSRKEHIIQKVRGSLGIKLKK